MKWLSRLWAKNEVWISPLDGLETLSARCGRPGRVPGIPPWEFFWREAGEPWRAYIWKPYYDSQSEEGKASYLDGGRVPEDWDTSCFDKARLEFWEHADDTD